MESTAQEKIVELSREKGYDRFHPDYFKNFSLEPVSWLLELTLLQKWLREAHSIHVFITKRYGWEYNVFTICPFGFENDGTYNSYEEALEDGLKSALSLVTSVIKKT